MQSIGIRHSNPNHVWRTGRGLPHRCAMRNRRRRRGFGGDVLHIGLSRTPVADTATSPSETAREQPREEVDESSERPSVCRQDCPSQSRPGLTQCGLLALLHHPEHLRHVSRSAGRYELGHPGHRPARQRDLPRLPSVGVQDDHHVRMRATDYPHGRLRRQSVWCPRAGQQDPPPARRFAAAPSATFSVTGPSACTRGPRPSAQTRSMNRCVVSELGRPVESTISPPAP